MEIGALTVMTVGFRERERILKLFELITGLRMNHAFIRPGGLAQDIPPGTLDAVRDALPGLRKGISDIEKLSNENPLVKAQARSTSGTSTSPGAWRSASPGRCCVRPVCPHDLRRATPYCGYETYDFDVITWDTADAYGRMRIRIEEMKESLKIVEQCLERLEKPGPVMVGDRKIAWPAQLAIGSDGMGNSLDHIRRSWASRWRP